MGPTASLCCALFVLCCAALWVPSCALPTAFEPRGASPGAFKQGSTIAVPTSPPSIIPPPAATNVSLDGSICLDCISFMDVNLDTLVKIVTRIGVVTACDEVCRFLNVTPVVRACDALCAVIGIQEFWQMFLSAGINPIWACEKLNACKSSANPVVNLISATVAPASGPAGSTFTFKMAFTVINQTGVGEVGYAVYFPAGGAHKLGYVGAQVFANYVPGQYAVSLQFPTNTTYTVGKYLVVFELCSGACGKAPSPYPYASSEFTFNLTAPST